MVMILIISQKQDLSYKSDHQTKSIIYGKTYMHEKKISC